MMRVLVTAKSLIPFAGRLPELEAERVGEVERRPWES